jgi:hypothetical protein
MVMKATIIPLAAIQSLITHVQIHAMRDFRQDIVTMSLPESWLYQQDASGRVGNVKYLLMGIQRVTHGECCAHLCTCGQNSKTNDRPRPMGFGLIS